MSGDIRANASVDGFLRMRLVSMKQRHKTKKFEGVLIRVEELQALYDEQRGICAITGLPMHTNTSESDLSLSPDRIDNTLGYTKANVRLVCARANLMMSTLDDAHFVWWCRAVVNNIGN